MNFKEIITTLQSASAYELYRLRAAINNEIENPDRIKKMRQRFAVGDNVAYFDEESNRLIEALVLEKNPKKVRVKNHYDQGIWNIPYYMLNLEKQESDISANYREKLSKNHFKVGDLVGFNHDGKEYTGTITKLNHKTVSLMTIENKGWLVGYSFLFKIFEGDASEYKAFNERVLEHG